jgi:hypothetical protein
LYDETAVEELVEAIARGSQFTIPAQPNCSANRHKEKEP